MKTLKELREIANIGVEANKPYEPHFPGTIKVKLEVEELLKLLDTVEKLKASLEWAHRILDGQSYAFDKEYAELKATWGGE